MGTNLDKLQNSLDKLGAIAISLCIIIMPLLVLLVFIMAILRQLF